MKITAVCNAGILIEASEYGILIDGVSDSFGPFEGTGDALFQDMLRKTGSFRNVKTLLFSHLHPDHYSETKVKELLAQHPELQVILPDDMVPVRKESCGPFQVICYRMLHMPDGQQPSFVYAFLVSCKEGSVYITSDAEIQVETHRKILEALRPDYIITNSVYLGTPDMADFLAVINPKCICVYHVPTNPEDPSGIRKKALRTVSRCEGRFSEIRLVTEYPQILLKNGRELHEEE